MADQILRAPGYYDREIDLSVREVEPTGTPTTIIGAALKGPAFVPVRLGAYADYEAKFGPLDPKFVAGYAAQQVLNSRPAAVFIRVLGAGANATSADFDNTRTKGIVRNAGMQVTGTVVSGDGRHSGAVQFIVAKHKVTASEAFGLPMFTDNDSFSLTSNNAYLVRAMLFTAADTRIMVMDTTQTFTNNMDDAASINDTATSAEYRKFKLVISSSAGASFGSDDGFSGIKIFTASLNPSDTSYIGKLLNTDPEKFETEKHLLWADFAVDDEIATVASGAGNTDSVAVLSGGVNTSATSGDTTLAFRNAFGRFDTRFTTPKTPWFVSQPFGTTEYDLFQVEAIDDGAYSNSKFKVSIANIKANTDPRNEYGTFTLLVRDFDDTDTEPRVIEQFNNLTLDPESDNYIAKIIGDKKVSYLFDVEDETDRKLKVTGTNANRSKFIRVVMSTAVATKMTPAKCLPFGFRGIEVVNTNPMMMDVTASAGSARLVGSGSGMDTRMTGSIVPPLPFRFKVTRGEVSGSSMFTGFPGPNEVVDARYFWGVKFERNTSVLNPNVANAQNNIVPSYTKFLGISKLDTLVTGSQKDTFNNNKFTLARVALSARSLSDVTASAAQHMKEAAYIRNGAPDASNYQITDGSWGSRVTLATILSKGSANDFNRFADFTKFTTVLYGGWDGVNVLDKNATRFWDRSTSSELSGSAHSGYTSPGATTGVNYSGVGTDNNAVRSFRTAIDIATDPIIANNNVLLIPGQRDPLLTDYACQKNQEYGFSMYVMDIPSYDSDQTRIFDGETGRMISVEKTADVFDARAIDYNGVAAYFPNFLMNDTINNRRVVVPASVAAGAAFAYNDKVAYPWWIPAGFNRNALGFVVQPTTRVTQADRNKLFDTRINPIVKFPGQGYVFYSQRTLQQAKTALESINVKRMILDVKRAVTDIGNRLIFEQITPQLRDQFTRAAINYLANVQLQQGVVSFRVICDDTNNTTQDVEANRMNAQIRLIPTRGVEYIQLDFIITPSGVTFE